MSGYTRQSVADIVPTAVVRAAPINAEYNKLRDAFAQSDTGTTGHKHDGTSDEGSYVPLIADTDAKNKVSVNTGQNRIEFYSEVSSAPVAQVYVQDGVILPVLNNDIDLGSAALKYKDFYLNGTASVGAIVAATADINAGTIDGTVIGGTTAAAGTFTDLTSTGTSTHAAVDINGGAIDGTTIGAATPSTVVGTTITANTQFTGDLVGDVTGDVTGNVTGNLTGNVTGNITSTGTSTFSAIDINGGAIDGTPIGSSTPSTAVFSSVTSTGATIASADINGGTVDNTTIGATTPSTIVGTTITANTGITGDLTGDVTGNVTGNLTGNVTGNITGDLTGNVTTATGTTTLNDLVVNGTVDFTSTALLNVSDPTAPQHAATKNYVDTNDALKLNLTGGTMSGDITMGGNTVTGLGTPTLSTDAATKGYVDAEVTALVDAAPGTLDTLNELAAALGDDADFSTTVTNSIATKLPLAGGTMTGDITMGANAVTSTATPTTDDELTRKGYVDTQDALKLDLAGGTMSGAIAMGTSKITGLGNPTAAQDAATKTYVDTVDATKLNLSGGTMTGNVVMGANKVTSTATPTADDDLTRKGYVDTILGSATAAATSAAAAATSESNAATSEANAASSESAAATSASNASTSETNAASSASAALTSESNAATSETAAALSETNAGTSETNAASSASAASTSATNAATSATNASNSASAASTSETNAATSESNASTSETNAATSASNAAASYDAFDDRYLGSKASAPTLDNDGNALLTGALYWNTGSNSLFIWTGSVWNAAAFNTSGALLAVNNLSDVQDPAVARTNLGLGTAATSAATDFVAVTGDSMTGALSVTAPSSAAAVFDRTTTEGDIVDFQYAGLSAGKIGVSNGYYVMGDGVSGLLYDPGTPSIMPFNYSGNDLANGTISLGLPSAKWNIVHTEDVQTGALNINGAIEFPTADGTSGQVLTTDGAGSITFADSYSSELYAENPVSATSPSATGESAVAIGSGSTATGAFGSAIGRNVTASGQDSLALNSGTTASGTYSIAGGLSTTASGAYAFAFGNSNTVAGDNSIGIHGDTAFSDSVAIGNGSTAANSGAIAIGNSRAAGTNGFAAAIGNNSSSYGTTGSYSVAIGRLALASGTQAVALNQATASGNYSFATIPTATASGSYTVAIGYGTTASSLTATAIGASSAGSGAQASGSGAVALGGSNAAGADSFAAAIDNNTSTYGATTTNTIAIGNLAKANAVTAVAIGDTARASQTGAIAMGKDALVTGLYSVALGGVSSQASATYATAINGYAPIADTMGKVVFGTAYSNWTRTPQTGIMTLFADTTDATATEILAQNTPLVLPNNSAYSFSGTIIARESAAAGSDYASWEIKGALLRDANAASTVLGNGIQNKLYATSGASAWAIALTADTTNGGLKIEVTGAASTNIRWVATLHSAEVTYA